MNFPFHGFIVYWNSTSPSPLKYSHSLNLKPHGFNGIPPSNPCFDPFPSFVACNLRAYFLLYFIIKKAKKEKKKKVKQEYLFFSSTCYLDRLLLVQVKREKTLEDRYRYNLRQRQIPGIPSASFKIRSKSRKKKWFIGKKRRREERSVFFFLLSLMSKIIAIRSDLINELV